VYPSAEGKRRHAAVARRRVKALCRILSAFDPDERAQLAVLLGRFVDAFDAHVGDQPAESGTAAGTDVRQATDADAQADRHAGASEPAEVGR
jgi:hypothetical protein